MNSVDGHRRLVSCVESGGAGLQFNSVVGTKLTGRIRSGLDTMVNDGMLQNTRSLALGQDPIQKYLAIQV